MASHSRMQWGFSAALCFSVSLLLFSNWRPAATLTALLGTLSLLLAFRKTSMSNRALTLDNSKVSLKFAGKLIEVPLQGAHLDASGPAMFLLRGERKLTLFLPLYENPHLLAQKLLELNAEGLGMSEHTKTRLIQAADPSQSPLKLRLRSMTESQF